MQDSCQSELARSALDWHATALFVLLKRASMVANRVEPDAGKVPGVEVGDPAIVPSARDAAEAILDAALARSDMRRTKKTEASKGAPPRPSAPWAVRKQAKYSPRRPPSS